MLIKFWGVRGSTPTPQAENLRYGGNTSCVEVRLGDRIYIFDCGTGFRVLGHALEKEFAEKPFAAHVFAWRRRKACWSTRPTTNRATARLIKQCASWPRARTSSSTTRSTCPRSTPPGDVDGDTATGAKRSMSSWKAARKN